MKEVELTMMPVCECGYVFSDLEYTNLGENKDGSVIGSIEFRFNPMYCPKCGGIIKSLKISIPKECNHVKFEDLRFV